MDINDDNTIDEIIDLLSQVKNKKNTLKDVINEQFDKMINDYIVKATDEIKNRYDNTSKAKEELIALLNEKEK